MRYLDEQVKETARVDQVFLRNAEVTLLAHDPRFSFHIPAISRPWNVIMTFITHAIASKHC